MDKHKAALEYVYSMMVVDKDLKVLHTNRFNPRFDGEEMKKNTKSIMGRVFSRFTPNWTPMRVQCWNVSKMEKPFIEIANCL